MSRRVWWVLAAALFVACGSDSKSTSSSASTATGSSSQSSSPSTTSSSSAGPTTQLKVYFLRDEKVGPARPAVPKTQAVARAALEQLAAGPSEAEREAGLTTSIPRELAVERLEIADGTATAPRT